MSGHPLLAAKGIYKSFGKHEVLHGVDFDLREGEIHALIGENGAGKSTLLRILFGVHKASAGTIEYKGETVRINSPMDAKSYGMAMINQEPQVFSDMSILENIFLGHLELTSARMVDYKRMEKIADGLLQKLGLNMDVHSKMMGLSVAEQQMVEIAGALSSNASIIFMDEPTASLTPDEVQRLMDLIRRLKSEGKTIVYISHRLEEIKQISDRVTVLCDGKKVGCYNTAEITIDDMICSMIGCTLGEMIKKEETEISDEPHFAVKGLTSHGAFSKVTFEVRRGEILGIAGLMGSGRTEIARTIFGVMKRDAGTIEIDGKPVVINSPIDAIRHGIALVPEDRHGLGLFLKKPIAFNTTFAASWKIKRKLGFIDRKREKDVTEKYVEQLKTKLTSIYHNVGDLSGGNQQKVSLAKWLATDPDVLILDEPTRGIDVGAKTEVYKIINQLARDKKCIILISSELEEVLALSDRIVVMYEGRQTALFDRSEINEVNVLAAAHDFA
ncbi:MAG: sugar ABC transporter ATP-binding protein [Christensenellaceae bacterium]|nr:sugar ABC transporter ATP-binding protein [Christensenellaceae bacterium]